MTALPDSIIQNGLFCCWKYEERNERKTKVPYQPQIGLGAKSNDPSSFVPYKTAVQASGYDGIGIGIFNGICAIDLDNCVSDSGYYTQTAAEIVALMHSYTEYSPSGNGLHILFSAKGFQYDTKRFYIQKQQIAVQKVEQIEPHAVPFSSKVMLDRSEYENLAIVAKKYVIQEKKERHLQKMLDAANKLISELTSKVTALTAELVEYKSVRGKLHTNELEHENRKLRDKLRSYEAVIDRHNLWHLFGRKRSKMVAREEIR